jgi:hypothetical protein
MATTSTTEIVGIRYHAASTQPIMPVPESEDVLFVDTRTTFVDDSGNTASRFDGYRLRSKSDISSQPELVQAVWNVIFGQSAQDQAAQAIAAAAALAAATTST